MAAIPVKRVPARVPDLPSFIPSVPIFDDENTLDAVSVGQAFLKKLASAVEERDWDAFDDLFIDESFWKDTLTLTFDKRTLHGKKTIVEAWKSLSSTRSPVIHTSKKHYALGLDTSFNRLAPALASLDVPFCFSTDAPRTNCVGLAKLIPRDGAWKIWTIATAVVSLEDYPFENLPRQSTSIVPDRQRGNPRSQGLPDVTGVFDAIVIGASMTGVANTIMLESIGANVIAFDNHEEAAGNWSGEGKACVIFHHLAKMVSLAQYPYPSDFPADLGGKDVTRYVSGAVEALNLPVFCGINVISNVYDETSKLWDVHIQDIKTKQEVTLKSKNILLATGTISSNANPRYPHLADREIFKGPVQHSTQYKDAEPFRGKNVVVVGASNSAHDIARDLAEGGAKDVTLLQRGPTAFFEWDKLGPVIEGRFSGDLTLDTADFLDFTSLPLGIARDFSRGAFAAIEAAQTDLYVRLEQKGYSIQRNRDFITQTFESRNGSCFMDRQKTLDIVLGGRINVARGVARRYVENGIVVYDKEKGEDKILDAEAIVLATGFVTLDLPKIWAETGFFDKKTAAALENPCAIDIDSEGELIGHHTYSGHPHVYFSGLNVIAHRWISRIVAIQVKADITNEFPARLYRV